MSTSGTQPDPYKMGIAPPPNFPQGGGYAVPPPTAAPIPIPQSVGLSPTGGAMAGTTPAAMSPDQMARMQGITPAGMPPAPDFKQTLGPPPVVGAPTYPSTTPYSPQMTHSLARLRGQRNQYNQYQ